MADVYTLGMFQPHVGETFMAVWEDNQAEAVLVEAKSFSELRPSTGYGFMSGSQEEDAAKARAFSLVFRFPLNVVSVPQQMFTLKREGVEDWALFLVTIAEDSAGRYMEAVFN